MHKSDVTIVGGGIMGLLSAREFSLAGAKVTLIEKGECGKESSWAGGGILLPLYPWRQAASITTLVLESLKSYSQLAQTLLADTGIDPQWQQSGLLITQNPDSDLATQWCQKNHVTYHTPADADLNALNAQVLNPILLPEIAHIRNPRLLKALKQDVLSKHVTLIENCELGQVTLRHQRVHDIHTSHGKIAVNELILTTGAWTRAFFQQHLIGLLDTPSIYPAKGEMLLFEAAPDMLKRIVLDGDHYLIPRRDGKILVGSTVECDVFQKNLTVKAHETLRDFAIQLLPALKDAPLIKHWAGLRPATDYGVPYIGRHPEIANLSLNAGHFRNGLSMAPASASLLVALVQGKPPAIDPSPYQFFKHLASIMS